MNNGLKFKICELHCFVQKTYSDMKIACDIAIYQENTSKYLISLGFLNKSYMTYIETKRFYRENEELVSVEFDNFFDTYDILEQELKKLFQLKIRILHCYIVDLISFSRKLKI